MLQVKGSNEQIYIRAFDRRELVVNSDCGIAMEKLYDLIKANLVVKETNYEKSIEKWKNFQKFFYRKKGNFNNRF